MSAASVWFQYASLGDYVWFDANHNGIQDAGEMGVKDVTVRLLDSQGNMITSMLSGLDGKYLFSGLTPGQYQVKFDLPESYVFTLQGIGNEQQDSDADPLTGLTGLITLISGQNDLTWDAGMTYIPEPATMGLLVLGSIAALGRRRRK
ncbi:MAG: PEP-CTERM sorting domain-containing protein [Planctomycetaceae bacterium]|nr:PEP-CTERM sorting domain-containing protein [Planctomycetaceae bacterium]